MGLQNQLSDMSSESTIILTVVLIARSVSYLRSLLFAILRGLGFFSPRFGSDHRHQFNTSAYDVVGSGLAGVILLCEQLNLNRLHSCANRSDGGTDRFGSDCVVCLNGFGDGDNVRKLACGHAFHKDCFDGWLEHLHFNCPVCRAPLVSDERVDCARRRVAGNLLGFVPLSMTDLHGAC